MMQSMMQVQTAGFWLCLGLWAFSCSPGVVGVHEDQFTAKTALDGPAQDGSPSQDGTNAREPQYSEKAICPVVLPRKGSFGHWRGWGQGETIGDAVREAQEDARLRAQNANSERFGEVEMAEFRAVTNTEWVRPTVYPLPRGGYESCAVALVDTEGLGNTTRKANRDLDDDLERLCSKIIEGQQRQGKINVLVSAPTWDDGTSPDVLALRIYHKIRSGLMVAAGKLGLTIVEPTTGTSPDIEIGGTLIEEGIDCRLLLRYRTHREKDWHLADAPIVFPPKSVGCGECRSPQEETFVSDRKMGLFRGTKRGVDGLTVHLEAPVHDGTLCEGMPFQMRVTTNRPARIRIYSVAEDGTVLMGWTSDGLVSDWTPKEAMAMRLPFGKEYRLMAVATATDNANPALLDTQSQVCRTQAGTGLNVSRVPGTAAHAITFTVVPMGEESCPVNEEMRRKAESMREGFERQPFCQP